jgi:hypothetical protein
MGLMQQSFSALMLDYAKGGVIDMQDLLRSFPARLLSVAEYVQHFRVNA